jgi:hypothetical protein
MKKRVGLAIAHDSIRAVVVKDGRLFWAGEMSREPGVPSAEEIVSLLGRAPLARWRRTPVVAAIGPHASQLKRIAGLPSVDDTRILAAIVRENAGTFFLQNGVPLAVTGIRPAEAGCVWAAAIETTHVACVRQACRNPRLKLCSIGPAAAFVPRAIRSESFQWTDGPVTLDITRSDAKLTAIRRISIALGNEADSVEPVAALEPLGENAPRFADAYGAAIAAVGEPLTLGPAGDVPWDRRRFRRRLLPPLVTIVFAAVAVLLSPLYPLRVARNAEASLRRLYASDQWRLMGEVLPQLERATAVLAELEQFAALRPQRTRLLAALATSLASQTAIVRFDIDNHEARLVVVAPRAQDVIAELEAIPGVDSVIQTGQVVRQNVAGKDLERVTVTFQYRPQVPRDSAAGGSR